MKIRVSGVEYEMGSLAAASLLDLIKLKQTTGQGMKSLQANLGRLSEFASPDDLLEDDEALVAVAALIWLSRRMAGETIGFEESASAPMSEIEFIADDTDVPDVVVEDVVPDPPLPDSGPAGEPVVAPI